MKDKLTYYLDRRGKWRWRLRARNNRVRAASSQGFATKGEARTNFAETAAAMIQTRA